MVTFQTNNIDNNNNNFCPQLAKECKNVIFPFMVMPLLGSLSVEGLPGREKMGKMLELVKKGGEEGEGNWGKWCEGVGGRVSGRMGLCLGVYSHFCSLLRFFFFFFFLHTFFLHTFFFFFELFLLSFSKHTF